VKSRLIAGIAAVVVAIVGILLIFSYAQSADSRAMQKLEPVKVLVVQKPVPAGTSAEALTKLVAVKEVPRTGVPGSALGSLADQAGKVTATDLVAGEQLVSERMIDPAALDVPGSVPVPKGLQEVTFALDPQRLVGGRIVAGDTVGLFVTFKGADVKDSPLPSTTGRVLHKVLVTSLQRAEAAQATPPASTDAAPNPQVLPAGTMLVTVAVGDRAAARIIYSAEFGSIWLTKEPADAKEDPPTQITRGDVYP
jgi:pilus assembly protein CpaB